MLVKQQYSVVLCAAFFGSLAQAVQFPTCITSCIRQAGCSPTDTDCMCEKASKNFLSDAVICMNQWCSKDTKFGDLVDPIKSNCDIPKSAIEAAEAKAGFDTGDTGSTPSSTSKPSSTGDASGASVSIVMSVGEPAKVDPTGSSISATDVAPTGTASKGNADTTGSAVLSGSTAVVTQTPTASGSLLVAASTFSSVATSTPSSSPSSGDSSSGSTTQGSSDGSPAGGSTAEGAGASSQASMLAAILAVTAAMAFGW